MKTKLFLSALLVMIMFSLALFADPVGEGTAAKPFEIETLADLQWLADNPGVWGSYFIQVDDIDASPIANWTRIGNVDDNFTGSYNGKGHTISGIKHNSNIMKNGLFGVLKDASISNLNVVNANIKGGNHVGILAGHIEGTTTVNRCYVSGYAEGLSGVGGLVGYSEHGSNVSITNSIADVEVKAN
ncbi:MAG: ZmpA/ZmpB/ZmpC family metallo-endopeptidase-related protein, partial [Candidatus Cloacimonas sp.]|nr:hypothetical protein [Candidatus Cloacimonadota bacterium]